jgi:hypothetical protein
MTDNPPQSPVLQSGDDLLRVARRYVGVGEDEFFALLQAEVGDDSVRELAVHGEEVDLGRWHTPLLRCVERREVMRRAATQRRASARARRARAARSAFRAGMGLLAGRGASG